MYIHKRTRRKLKAKRIGKIVGAFYILDDNNEIVMKNPSWRLSNEILEPELKLIKLTNIIEVND